MLRSSGINLTSILFEVYNPGLQMEDFMAPNQHLPERQYPCGDCKQIFNSAVEFSDHFEREGLEIIGCKSATPNLPFVEGRRARLEV